MHGVDSKFPESGEEPLSTARARPHLDGELEGRTATFPSSMTPRSRQWTNLLPPEQTLRPAELVVSWRPSCRAAFAIS